MKIWGSVRQDAKIIGFFYIFWDILNKKKVNLGQKCVIKRAISFQGKIGTMRLTSFEKNNSFHSLGSSFPNHPSIKSGVSHPYKNYIFGMSN